MRRIVLILVVAVLVGSCSGASDGATTPPPASSQAAATGNINASFDVGGHKLHLRCEGAGSPGSPTVVYLHGLGGDGSDIKPTASATSTPFWARPLSRGRTCWSGSPLVACWPACTPAPTPTRSWDWNGRLVEVQSSHDIDLDQPELVINEINRILETA
jgi:hypothetical protein